MFLFKKHLSRWQVLKGAGATIALPLLDAMTPAFASANRLGGQQALRMAFLYVPKDTIIKD